MGEERQEVYERIPWETLEKQGGDRQWLLIAVAGAIVAGALAYSFMQNQSAPTAAPVVEAAAPTTPATASVPAAPVTTVATPLLTAEADLYAVHPEDLAHRASAHAEWFAVEYFSADGSEESRRTLQSMMPAGIPLPEVPDGTQVFVDWVGTQTVTESTPLSYSVEVVVRSLVARGEGGFVRQPARVATVAVTFGDDGQPRVSHPPSVAVPTPSPQPPMALMALPDQVRADIEASHGPVLGGEQLPDGRWQVVVMDTGIDGVRRPTTVVVP